MEPCRFYVHNLGCKVNRAESNSIIAYYLSNGFTESGPGDADLVIINTCTVTAEADHKTRKAIRHFAGMPQHPRVIVTGCGAVAYGAALEELGDNIKVSVDKPDCPPARNVDSQPAGHHARVDIKVQDGCDNRCTYCIVPYVRGRARSVPQASIISEVQDIVSAGVHEIVLTGINLGRYHSDDAKDAGLPGLLKAICDLCDGFRVRLSSIEPEDVTPGLLEAMSSHKHRICAHLHIPLQSGSDDILAAMGRHYDTAAYMGVVEAARDALPNIALSTDVIVGFPGEEDEDFKRTCTICRMAGFSRVHVFRYSMRPGTPAASMPGQLPSAVKQKRSEALRALADDLQTADAQARIGSVEQVLIEDVGIGRTESYHRIEMPKDEIAAPVGGLCRMRIQPGTRMALRGAPMAQSR
ncbi:MAG: MiaB/RimO family radical SAM methylthiotransferase [Coriobacteriales bacterium]|jgi:threonylcarbamoyladenosine tRNA methylthiotransferase MtaB|nr:MiaB/RimO family radical SAM methylthiotransferase [Coriobacteriales bacterium]